MDAVANSTLSDSDADPRARAPPTECIQRFCVGRYAILRMILISAFCFFAPDRRFTLYFLYVAKLRSDCVTHVYLFHFFY